MTEASKLSEREQTADLIFRSVEPILAELEEPTRADYLTAADAILALRSSDAVQALEKVRKICQRPVNLDDRETLLRICNAALTHRHTPAESAGLQNELIDRLLGYADNCEADNMFEQGKDLRAACDLIRSQK